MATFKLLSAANPKTIKGESKGYLTFILHLAPSTLSGYNTCPKASQGCVKACLNTAGRGGMFKAGETTNIVQQARIRKTRYFFENRQGFMSDLVSDIQNAIKYAKKQGMTPVFRLNGTSDIAWEKYEVSVNNMTFPNVFMAFSDIQFYDYTAILGRKVNHIENYHLTFSAKEDNHKDIDKALEQGLNVAMVFNTPKGLPMPKEYQNTPVFNGDNSDLRFLDPIKHIIGLYAKGKAKKDNSGFVRTVWLKAA